MKTELFYLALVAALTGLLWVPYILDRIAQVGFAPGGRLPTEPAAAIPVGAAPDAGPFQRAIENLAVFAALVRWRMPRASATAIATASMVYFWARLVHVLAYTFAIPWVRTLAFTVGFAQAVIAWQVLVR